jgi:hypothetical protein
MDSRFLAIGLAAGLVLPAGSRAIGLVDQNIIVARGANHAVDRLAELFVGCASGVFLPGLLAAHRHFGPPQVPVILANYAWQKRPRPGSDPGALPAPLPSVVVFPGRESFGLSSFERP